MVKIYEHKLIWLRYTTTKEDTLGGEPGDFEDNGELWGNVEELSASESIKAATAGSLAHCKIRINNLIAIKSTDQLRDKYSGDVYVIVGPPLRLEDQTLVYCYRTEVGEEPTSE